MSFIGNSPRDSWLVVLLPAQPPTLCPLLPKMDLSPFHPLLHAWFPVSLLPVGCSWLEGREEAACIAALLISTKYVNPQPSPPPTPHAQPLNYLQSLLSSLHPMPQPQESDRFCGKQLEVPYSWPLCWSPLNWASQRKMTGASAYQVFSVLCVLLLLPVHECGRSSHQLFA